MKNIDDLQEQMEIAERLQLLRNAKGFIQKDMAELLEMSYHTYVKLENASHGITTKNLIKVCKILNVSADLILFGVTGNDNINFAEYIRCARLLSDDGIGEIEDSVALIKKLRGSGQEEQSADAEEKEAALDV